MRKQNNVGGVIAALNNKKARYVVGIDPDIGKSGVCMIDKDAKEITDLCALSFPVLAGVLQKWGEMYGEDMCVYIELPQSEHNWQIAARARYARNPVSYAANAGVDVGRCREVAISLKEWCDYHHVQADTVNPLVKIWGGGKEKINAKEFSSVTGWIGRTNSEMRDAGLLAWYYSNLPIKVKSGK